jgi:hypothetical protein
VNFLFHRVVLTGKEVEGKRCSGWRGEKRRGAGKCIQVFGQKQLFSTQCIHISGIKLRAEIRLLWEPVEKPGNFLKYNNRSGGKQKIPPALLQGDE